MEKDVDTYNSAMNLHFSDSTLAALIRGAATVLAAVIPVLISRRKHRRSAKRSRVD